MGTNENIVTDYRTLDDWLDQKYGVPGTAEREEFDSETAEFCLAATLKEERLRAGMTQQELADKLGTKKSYISRLENGKSDVTIATLRKIFSGLGRRVAISIL